MSQFAIKKNSDNLRNYQQLLIGPDQDVKNYADQGDLHNSSHRTKAEFNNCFIIHSKHFNALNKFTSSQHSSKLWFQSQDLNTGFFLADTPQKVGNIHRIICFAYSCFHSVRCSSEIKLFRLRPPRLETTLIDGLLSMQPRVQPNRWYIARIF